MVSMREPYSPVRDRYKIVIIDEAHMLSKQAFNSLLKTLEEPPSHVVFILATTEVGKILATIQSRYSARVISLAFITQSIAPSSA